MCRITATGFSGLQAQQSVPNFSAMIAQLDPAVAATINALNTTLPALLALSTSCKKVSCELNWR